MGAAPSAEAVAGLWRERPRDVLGLPRFTPDELATLLAAHAPALEVETRAGFDRYGALDTAFVGRSHFDDADLIERRFVIPSLDRQHAANAPGT